MSRVNRVPFGLQDLLGSQNFGDNPSDFAQTIAPTIDMFPFLAQERITEWVSATSPVTSSATFAQVSVPQGELWLLDSVGCRFKETGVAPSGTRLDMSVSYQYPPNSSLPNDLHPLAHFMEYFSVDLAQDFIFYTHEFPRLLPMSGGILFQFKASVTAITTGQFDSKGFIRYYRLKV